MAAAESLTVHMKVEERFLYPIVADVEGAETEEEAEVEHSLTREGLQAGSTDDLTKDELADAVRKTR